MVSAADLLKTLNRAGDGSTESGSFDLRAYELRKAERYNRSAGTQPDYDCKQCQNRGNFMRIIEEDGRFSEVYEKCRCMKIRESIWRLKQSGLEKTIRSCTFDRFEAIEDWQKTMLDAATDYAKNGGDSWFFIGGQPGCGKTHLCTAICRDALYAGKSVCYMAWMTKSVDLKAAMYDAPDAYNAEIGQIKRIELLYIDDFFKPVRDMQPTAADIKLAYDIINWRYINGLPTIISSEKTALELMDIDEATGSRIYEKSKGYNLTIERGPGKNWRLREAGL